MTDEMDVYPPDMEPADDNAPQMVRFGDVIEELHESLQGTEHERTQEELLYDMRSFAEYWIAQGDMTGETWDAKDGGDKIKTSISQGGGLSIPREDMEDEGIDPKTPFVMDIPNTGGGDSVRLTAKASEGTTFVQLGYSNMEKLGINEGDEFVVKLSKTGGE